MNRERVHRRWLVKYQSGYFALRGHLDEPPIVEAAFPELTEVDGDLRLCRVSFDDVSGLYLVPSEHSLMTRRKGRWR